MIIALSDGSLVGFNKNATNCGVPPGTLINENALANALSDCIGFIDVNGPNSPNHEITCKDAAANDSGTICPQEKTVGDVYPVVFHDATVELVSFDILKKAALARRRQFDKWEVKAITAGQGMTRKECLEVHAQYGIKYCNSGDDDLWAAAVKECGGIDRIASDDDLLALAKTMHTACNANGAIGCIGFDSSKVPSNLSGLGSDWYYLWTGTESTVSRAHVMHFNYDSLRTRIENSERMSRYLTSSVRFVCVDDW